MTTRELSRDLNDRKKIYRRTQHLRELIYTPGLRGGPISFEVRRGTGLLGTVAPDWKPSDESSPFISRHAPYTQNCLIASISERVNNSRDDLLIAGLSSDDLAVWRAHFDFKSTALNSNELTATCVQKTFYVHEIEQLFEIKAEGDIVEADLLPGSTSEEDFERISAENDRRLDELSKIVARLSDAVRRLYLTLSQEGILKRLKVIPAKYEARLDSETFTGLNESEVTFLDYVRRGAGEWVSSKEIEDGEAKQIKVGRAIASLKKRYPALFKIIEIKRGAGSRIVLPLPPVRRPSVSVT